MTAPERRAAWFGYAGLLALVLSVVLFVVTILYANRVGQRSDEKAAQSQRNWCALIVTLDDAYRTQPPQSPTGQQVAAEVHALRLNLNC